KTLFLLPNMITLSSIFCGFVSIRLSASASGEDQFYKAALLIVFAMFFDILDGRVARATKTQSAFGLQIDSLAVVISFGVAPAMLVYEWTLHRLDGNANVSLHIPGAAGILGSIIVATHAAAGIFGGVEYVWALFAVTIGLSFLM